MSRPTVVTPEVLQKLEYAFLLGCSDLEACFYADIAAGTLYNYQTAHPEFLERKEELKSNPIFIARKSVVDKMTDDGDLALKYLERKLKAEFSTKTEVDQHLSGGVEVKTITRTIIDPANGIEHSNA